MDLSFNTGIREVKTLSKRKFSKKKISFEERIPKSNHGGLPRI